LCVALLSVSCLGTRNIRIDRIAPSVVSANPIVIFSQSWESCVGVRGDICAYSRNLRECRAITSAVHFKPGFVVRIIGPGQIDLARRHCGSRKVCRSLRSRCWSRRWGCSRRWSWGSDRCWSRGGSGLRQGRHTDDIGVAAGSAGVVGPHSVVIRRVCI
jgi:hypothetical protein